MTMVLALLVIFFIATISCLSFVIEATKEDKSVKDFEQFNKYGVRKADNKDIRLEHTYKGNVKVLVIALIFSLVVVLGGYFVFGISANGVPIGIMYIVMFMAGLSIVLPLYMYPTKVARRTEHDQISAIAWLNFFLGGTIILWIVLLIWASSKKPQPVVTQESSLTDKLQEIQRLKDQGVLTEEEFEAKKKQILNL